ncbi:MFS transporter [Rhodobacter sp. JA431]|uniref:MFS transporter n=1 Tax=Rhodobacter sp. JA431 TaxID=570013 RepID=UPI000BCB9B3F|nr:MFS transporter [Rhodobacter sp. JA431]SOC10455.1 MFS transporter [Rhodobacter sp. JA431]
MRLGQVMRASRETGLALARLGAFWGAFAAYLPDYKLRAGVDDGTFGLLLLCAALGGVGAMALVPRITAKLGARSLKVLAFVLVAVTFVPLMIHSALGLAAALLLMGAAMSALDIAANVRISEAEHDTGLPLMNWNHALFSFGLGGAALLAGALRGAGFPPELVQPGLALALVLVASRLHVARDSAGPEADAPSAGPSPMPWAVVLPAAAIFFAAFVTENTTETWSALYLERGLGGVVGAGALGPAMFGLVMGLFRLGGQMLAARLGEARLVAFSAAAGAVGAVITAAAPTLPLAVLGLGLIGVGAAVVVPSTNALLGQRVTRAARARALSRAWMIGFSGFFIGPVLMGALAEWAGLRVVFLMLALAMAAVGPGLWALMRMPRT